MNIEGLTYEGKRVDDQETFNLLPPLLQEFISQRNGFIALKGGIHFRGCTNNPIWHSLGEYCKGRHSFHIIYDSVLEDDIPFGQDCFGDQFLLRGDAIYKLSSETGELAQLSDSLSKFLEEIERNPIEFLGLEAFQDLIDSGFELLPGELISIHPPFIIDFEGERTARPISVEGRLSSLKKLYVEIKDIPDGTFVKIDPKNR